MDADRMDLDEVADLGLTEGSDLLEVDADPPAPPPRAAGGGGPSSDRDTWLAKSPFWAIPLLVSVIFGIERVAMLAIVPGYRDLPIIIFGSLFVVTFAIVLAAGGMAIRQYRR